MNYCITFQYKCFLCFVMFVLCFIVCLQRQASAKVKEESSSGTVVNSVYDRDFVVRFESELMRLKIDFEKNQSVDGLNRDALKQFIEGVKREQDAKLDGLGQRLGDQASRISDIVGVIDYLVAIFFGISLASYYFSTKKASEKAKAEFDSWMKSEREKLDKEIDLVKMYAAEAKSRMEYDAENIHKMRAAIEKSIIIDSRGDATTGQMEEIYKIDKELEGESEDSYTPMDWYIKGVAAYYKDEFDYAIGCFDKSIKHIDANEISIAKSMLGRAVCLSVLKRFGEAIKCYDEIEERFYGKLNPELNIIVAKSLFNKAFMFNQSSNRQEEIAVYNALESRFGTSSEPALQEQVAKALVNKSIALSQLESFEEAVAVCDLVDSRYGTSPEPALLVQVAMALVNKGFALGQLERLGEAVAVYDLVESRYGTSLEPALREQVAKALVNKGIALSQLESFEEAVAVCDLVDGRYSTSSEPALLENVAKALVNKCVTLNQLGNYEEAVVVCDLVESRYSTSLESALREQVAKALVNKGFALGQLRSFEEAVVVCDLVESRYGTSPERVLQNQLAKAKELKKMIREAISDMS